jgi:hypothetical protein
LIHIKDASEWRRVRRAHGSRLSLVPAFEGLRPGDGIGLEGRPARALT